MAITIQDIAKYLDIAPSTVSKALNDYPHISAETKTRVLDASDELGYVPSAAARNLRRKRTEKIGFSFSFPFQWISDYVSGLISGAVMAAEKKGYNLTIYPSNEDQVSQLRKITRAGEVDGILLLGRQQMAHTTIPLLKDEGIPFVVVGRWVEDETISFVKPDDPKGAFTITNHLIEMGHRRIGFTIRPSVGATSRDRFSGYKKALEMANIPLDESLIVTTMMEEGSGYKAMNKLLDLPDPPTAVFAIHDRVAIECLQAVKDRGLKVPDDIAIAGFDNWRVSLTSIPPLTTINPPLEEIGFQAMSILLNKIQNPEQPAIRKVLPVELHTRQSTNKQFEI